MTQEQEGLCLRIVRPIHDPAKSNAELTREAETLLAERACAYGVKLRRGAEIQMRRAHGFEVEGWQAWNGEILIATVAVALPEPDGEGPELEVLIAERYGFTARRAPIDPNRLNIENVEYCLGGGEVMLSPAEKEVAVHLGIKRGITKRRLGQLLHISGTEVNRYLSRKQRRGLVRAA